MASKLEQYLSEIRSFNGLRNAILCGISIEKRTKVAEFFLVTDKTYSAEEETGARNVTSAYLPEGFSVKMHIVKRVPDAEVLKEKIFTYIRRGKYSTTLAGI